MAGPVYSEAMSGDIEALLQAAIAHHRAGRLTEASEGYRAVLAQAPEHAHALNFLGMIALQAGAHDDAVRLLGRAIAAAPTMAEAHNHLGLALQRTARPDAALAAFARAVALKPALADAHYHLAGAARTAGDLPRAEAAYRAAITADARFASAYLELGALLHGQRRLDDAAAVYRQALAVRDDYAPILSNLALVRHQQGALAEAIGLAERAGRAEPASAELATNLGILLQEAGRLDDAGAAFQRALVAKPDYAPALSHAGLLAHELGRTDEAIGRFEAVLRLKPDDEDAKFMLAVLRATPLAGAPAGYVSRLFDQYAPRFDDHLTRTLGYRAPEDLAAMIAALEDGKPRETALDVGCGTGLSGLPFRARVRRLIGLDLSAEMLARARARGIYDELHQADAREFLARFAGMVDLVIAADVLVYVGDAAPWFEALMFRMPPGGLIALSIERRAEGTFALEPTGRFSHNPEHIAALGAGAGFELRAARDSIIRHERRAPAHGALMVLQKV
jgi:predicted TPR repeat methyltransferase